MRSNKNQRRYLRKIKKMMRNKIRNAKYHDWNQPNEADGVVYVGMNNNGKVLVSSHVVHKQIDFLKSKMSKVQRNNIPLHLDNIFIQARKPVTLDQHRDEYGTLIMPRLLSHTMQYEAMHPEEFKNEVQELYRSDLYTTSLAEYIQDDRRTRCDESITMADLEPVIAVTFKENHIIRIEFYMGHNKIDKKLDLRAPELEDQELKDSYCSDFSYDVAKSEYWTASMMGMKLSEFKEMQDYVHEALFMDFCTITFKKNGIKAA